MIESVSSESGCFEDPYNRSLLPPELVRMIALETEERETLHSLGSTCKYFFDICEEVSKEVSIAKTIRRTIGLMQCLRHDKRVVLPDDIDPSCPVSDLERIHKFFCARNNLLFLETVMRLEHLDRQDGPKTTRDYWERYQAIQADGGKKVVRKLTSANLRLLGLTDVPQIGCNKLERLCLEGNYISLPLELKCFPKLKMLYVDKRVFPRDATLTNIMRLFEQNGNLAQIMLFDNSSLDQRMWTTYDRPPKPLVEKKLRVWKCCTIS